MQHKHRQKEGCASHFIGYGKESNGVQVPLSLDKLVRNFMQFEKTCHVGLTSWCPDAVGRLQQ